MQITDEEIVLLGSKISQDLGFYTTEGEVRLELFELIKEWFINNRSNNHKNISENVHLSEYPLPVKGQMGVVGRPTTGIQIEYSTEDEHFTVCCDSYPSQVKNRNKCLDVIQTYINTR